GLPDAIRHVQRTPLPAALVDRGIRSVLCRARSQRLGACVCLFRGGAQPSLSSQATHQVKSRRVSNDSCPFGWDKKLPLILLKTAAICPEKRIDAFVVLDRGDDRHCAISFEQSGPPRPSPSRSRLEERVGCP